VLKNSRVKKNPVKPRIISQNIYIESSEEIISFMKANFNEKILRMLRRDDEKEEGVLRFIKFGRRGEISESFNL